jgi:hypothetical protein
VPGERTGGRGGRGGWVGVVSSPRFLVSEGVGWGRPGPGVEGTRRRGPL